MFPAVSRGPPRSRHVCSAQPLVRLLGGSDLSSPPSQGPCFGSQAHLHEKCPNWYPKGMHSVLSSTVHNSPNPETPQMSTESRMENKVWCVLCSRQGMLHSGGEHIRTTGHSADHKHNASEGSPRQKVPTAGFRLQKVQNSDPPNSGR